MQENTDALYPLLLSLLESPGAKIDRTTFLTRELSKKFSNEIVLIAIESSPAEAGIRLEDLETIANECIKYEASQTSIVSSISKITGMNKIAQNISEDSAKYYYQVVRVMQKLMYLYGWKEIQSLDGQLDDETANQLTNFLNIMFGLNQASEKISNLSDALAEKVEDVLSSQKGFFKIAQKVTKPLGIKFSKKDFAQNVSGVIPTVGNALTGGITFVTFKPMANRLKEYLKSLLDNQNTLPVPNSDSYQ